MAQKTQNDITFDSYKDRGGQTVAAIPIRMAGNQQDPDEDGGIINAVDIDWNDGQLQLDELRTIRTTGQLFTAIKDAYDHYPDTNQLLPTATGSDENKFLKGDGTWATPTIQNSTEFEISESTSPPGIEFKINDVSRTVGQATAAQYGVVKGDFDKISTSIKGGNLTGGNYITIDGSTLVINITGNGSLPITDIKEILRYQIVKDGNPNISNIVVNLHKQSDSKLYLSSKSTLHITVFGNQEGIFYFNIKGPVQKVDYSDIQILDPSDNTTPLNIKSFNCKYNWTDETFVTIQEEGNTGSTTGNIKVNGISPDSNGNIQLTPGNIDGDLPNVIKDAIKIGAKTNVNNLSNQLSFIQFNNIKSNKVIALTQLVSGIKLNQDDSSLSGIVNLNLQNKLNKSKITYSQDEDALTIDKT